MIQSSPFAKKQNSVTELMLWVVGATLLGLAAQVYYFGVGVIVNIILATVTALATEAVILKLRKRPIKRTLLDGSALVTAWLLALALPPLLPWWMTVLGASFAIIFAKQIYGGLGNNIFNPAMVAYVLLLISFPVQMTTWMPPAELAQNSASISETLSFIFTGKGINGLTIEQMRLGVDGFSMATPLDHVKSELSQGYRIVEIKEAPLFSNLSGIGWQWINLGFLIGGLVLLFKKVVNWHIPFGVLAGIFAMSCLLYIISPDQYLSPLFHWFAGATMLGAFFIATDPVTASTTPKGRILFGLGIGILTVLIRTFGGYPDAIAFAVLLLNMAVPLIDYYTKPRVYGHKANSRSGA